MKSKKEILDFISGKLESSERLMFISKEVAGDKANVCLLSPSEETALICVALWLMDKPHHWSVLKEVMQEKEKKE